MRIVQIYEKQDIVPLLDGHNKTFQYYGGQTKDILYDNL
jgi:transposase